MTYPPSVYDDYLFPTLPVTGNRILVGSIGWFYWLCKPNNTNFYCETELGNFIARKEICQKNAYWWAYKKINRRLKKVYLGRSQYLTKEKLVEACRKINAALPDSCQPASNQNAKEETKSDDLMKNYLSGWQNHEELPK